MVGVEGGVAISVRGLTTGTRAPEGTLAVLENVDLDVPAGGYVTVTGPSGAGKSTLLSVVGGLEPLQEGSASVGDVDLAGLGGDELAAYRRATVGFVFQHFGLLDALTALRTSSWPPSSPARHRASGAAGPRSCWTRSAWPTGPATSRCSSRGASASGWRSPGRWPTGRDCCWPMSRREIWTKAPPPP